MEEKQHYLSGQPEYVQAAVTLIKNALKQGKKELQILDPFLTLCLPTVMADIISFLSKENILVEIDSFCEDGRDYIFIREQTASEPFRYLSGRADYVDSVVVLFKNVLKHGGTHEKYRTNFEPELLTLIMADLINLFQVENISIIIYEESGSIKIRLPLEL